MWGGLAICTVYSQYRGNRWLVLSLGAFANRPGGDFPSCAANRCAGAKWRCRLASARYPDCQAYVSHSIGPACYRSGPLIIKCIAGLGILCGSILRSRSTLLLSPAYYNQNEAFYSRTVRCHAMIQPPSSACRNETDQNPGRLCV